MISDDGPVSSMTWTLVPRTCLPDNGLLAKPRKLKNKIRINPPRRIMYHVEESKQVTSALIQTADSQLIQLTREGDKSAFGELVRRYQGLVYGIAYHQLGSFADAQDIAQESFIKAFRCIGQLDQPDRFSAWLRTITTNQCRMLQRRAHPTIPLEDVETSPAYTTLAADMWKQKERQSEIRQAVDYLPDKSRLIVNLHYLSGLSHQEIGDFLGITANAVSQHLHRARLQLKDMLMAEIEEGYVMNQLPENFAEEVLGKLTLYPMREGYFVTNEFTGDTNGIMLAVEGPAEKKSYIQIWMRGDDMSEITLGTTPNRTAENAKGRALDSALDMLRTFDIELQRVVLRLSDDRKCRADVTLKRGDNEQTLDMRASDAMAMAVRVQAPILAEDAVIMMGNVGEGDVPTPDERVNNEAYNKEFARLHQHDELRDKALELGLSTEDWMDTARFSIDHSQGTIRIWLEAKPENAMVLNAEDYPAGIEMLTDLAQRRGNTGLMTGGEPSRGWQNYYKFCFSMFEGDIRVRMVEDKAAMEGGEKAGNGDE